MCKHKCPGPDPKLWYWVTQKLPQIYTANHATFQIRIRKIAIQRFPFTCAPIYEIPSNISTMILGDPEATANIYCKSRNLPNTDT